MESVFTAIQTVMSKEKIVKAQMEDAEIPQIVLKSKIELPKEWKEIWEHDQQPHILVNTEEIAKVIQNLLVLENLYFDNLILK